MVANIKNAFHRSLVDSKQPRKESVKLKKINRYYKLTKKKKNSVGVKQNVVSTY